MGISGGGCCINKRPDGRVCVYWSRLRECVYRVCGIVEAERVECVWGRGLRGWGLTWL